VGLAHVDHDREVELGREIELRLEAPRLDLPRIEIVVVVETDLADRDEAALEEEIAQAREVVIETGARGVGAEGIEPRRRVEVARAPAREVARRDRVLDPRADRDAGLEAGGARAIEDRRALAAEAHVRQVAVRVDHGRPE
jgi:hypothetical protein